MEAAPAPAAEEWAIGVMLQDLPPLPLPPPSPSTSTTHSPSPSPSTAARALQLTGAISMARERKKAVLREARLDVRAFVRANVPALCPRERVPGRLKPAKEAEEMRLYKRQWYLTNRRRVIMKAAIGRHLVGMHESKDREEPARPGRRRRPHARDLACPLCDRCAALDAEVAAYEREREALTRRPPNP